MSAKAIELHGLTYRWRGAPVPALQEVSLTIAVGERVAVLGPNGAGKSTLLAHLNGARLASPPVQIGGTPIDRAHLAEIRRRVGVVQQETDDQLFLPTVREDVAFGPQNAGLPPDEVDRRVDAALAQVGATALAARTHSALSGGERRRVALATVLSMDVELLVLDEPTSNLDARGRRAIAALVRALPRTLVVATHDVEFVRAVCDRVIVLDEGRVVADGAADVLLEDRALLERHGVL